MLDLKPLFVKRTCTLPLDSSLEEQRPESGEWQKSAPSKNHCNTILKPTQGQFIDTASNNTQEFPRLTCTDQNYWTLGILHEGVHSHPETLVFFEDDINLRDKDKTELYWYPTPLTYLVKHAEFDSKDLFQPSIVRIY